MLVPCTPKDARAKVVLLVSDFSEKGLGARFPPPLAIFSINKEMFSET